MGCPPSGVTSGRGRLAFRGGSRGFSGRPGARCDRMRILRALAGRFLDFRWPSPTNGTPLQVDESRRSEGGPGNHPEKEQEQGKTLFRQKPGPPGAVEKNYFLFRAGERWASWLGFLEGVLEPLHRIVIFDPGKKKEQGKTLFRQKPGPPGAVEKNYAGRRKRHPSSAVHRKGGLLVQPPRPSKKSLRSFPPGGGVTA